MNRLASPHSFNNCFIHIENIFRSSCLFFHIRRSFSVLLRIAFLLLINDNNNIIIIIIILIMHALATNVTLKSDATHHLWIFSVVCIGLSLHFLAYIYVFIYGNETSYPIPDKRKSRAFPANHVFAALTFINVTDRDFLINKYMRSKVSKAR